MSQHQGKLNNHSEGQAGAVQQPQWTPGDGQCSGYSEP